MIKYNLSVLNHLLLLCFERSIIEFMFLINYCYTNLFSARTLSSNRKGFVFNLPSSYFFRVGCWSVRADVIFIIIHSVVDIHKKTVNCHLLLLEVLILYICTVLCFEIEWVNKKIKTGYLSLVSNHDFWISKNWFNISQRTHYFQFKIILRVLKLVFVLIFV